MPGWGQAVKQFAVKRNRTDGPALSRGKVVVAPGVILKELLHRHCDGDRLVPRQPAEHVLKMAFGQRQIGRTATERAVDNDLMRKTLVFNEADVFICHILNPAKIG